MRDQLRLPRTLRRSFRRSPARPRQLLAGLLALTAIQLAGAPSASAQACAPEPAGLVSWWPAEGNANDAVGSNHGTAFGGLGYAPGVVGQAFSLDGVNDYVQVPNSTSLTMGTRDFTVTAWIKIVDPAHLHRIVDTGGRKHEGYSIVHSSPQFFGQPGPSNFVGQWRRGGPPPDGGPDRQSFGGGPTLTDNLWHHVAAVWDRDLVVETYVDGVPYGAVVPKFPANEHIANAFNLRIGSEAAAVRQLTEGRIDEVQIYARALTAGEILALYDAGSASICPDSDGDGVPDPDDICPGGDDGADADGDGVPDFCDPCPNDAQNDADGDGICGDVDVCAGGDDNLNADGDTLPDFCDVCPLDPENDADGDGICEVDDNCPTVANSNQDDLDGDDLGDACDSDVDGDGVPNSGDNCVFDANGDQTDTDQDGAGDVCDDDLDGDGVVDADDACVPSPAGEIVDATGCGISALCPCEHPVGGSKWKNHGAYVSCVAHASEDFLDAGLITEAEKDAIVSEAGESTCGHKNK